MLAALLLAAAPGGGAVAQNFVVSPGGGYSRPGSAMQYTPMKDKPGRVTMSVLNELWTAVDSGREYLAQCIAAAAPGSPADASVYCAFVDGGAARGPQSGLVDPLSSAAEYAARAISAASSAGDMAQLAQVALFLELAGARPDLRARAARKLSLANVDALSAYDAAAVFEARELQGEFPPEHGDWALVVSKALKSGEASPGIVALSAMSRSAGGADRSGNAVRAHLRWLKGNLDPARCTMRDYWWLARWLDTLPPAVLYEERFPMDWRIKMAGEIISSQRRLVIGGQAMGVWLRDGEPSPVETAYAVRALALIAEQ